MTTLLLDVRYALRMWRKHLMFTAAALGTIAIAIGANTVIFALVHGVLLKPLGLPDSDRVVRIEEQHGGRRMNLTGATFIDLHDRTRLLGAVAEYRIRSVGLDADGAPEQLTAADVSPDYFDVLGAPAARGRWFKADDFVAGAGLAVVIGNGLWRRSFGGADAVGRRVVIDTVPMEIVGIAPVGLFAPGSPDLWLPQSASSPLLQNRRAHLFTTIGRLAANASVASVRQEIASLARGIEGDAGNVDPDMGLLAEPLQARMVESIRPALLMLWAGVGMVLLIAAANIANLLLMQGVSRTRELSIRVALGATRPRVARQIVTECTLLACTGGLLGTGLGWWALPAFRAALPASIPRAESLSADVSVLLFGIGVSSLMAALIGLAPALRRYGPSSDGRTSRAHEHNRFAVGRAIAPRDRGSCAHRDLAQWRSASRTQPVDDSAGSTRI